MASVNYESIRKKIANSNELKNTIDKKIKEKFEEQKEIFINKFENHPVTQEIEDGPEASNKSGTLGGVGNLFSFIGFNKEDDPISNLKTFIERSFSISKSSVKTSNSNIKFNYKIKYPGAQEISKASPMPWENGKSWALGIERGISGFGYYMYKKFNQGRSGSALQTKDKLRSGGFKNQSYISDIIQKFVNSFKS